jgi:hypothetical protein
MRQLITVLACALLLGAAAEKPGRLLVLGSLVDEADAAKPGDLWLCIGDQSKSAAPCARPRVRSSHLQSQTDLPRIVWK